MMTLLLVLIPNANRAEIAVSVCQPVRWAAVASNRTRRLDTVVWASPSIRIKLITWEDCAAFVERF
jgi:hypothetical protein